MPHVAVLTGATGGLGGAILHALIAADYHVIACGRNPTKLTALHETYGQQVTPCGFSLSETPRMTMQSLLSRALEPYDFCVDLLVCAHGAAPCTTPMRDLMESDFHEMYCTDVLGAFRIVQLVGEYMCCARKGSIVLLSSAHAHQTYPMRLPYSVAKSAIVAMARALAIEWGEYGITVNSISPWQVSSLRTDTFVVKEKEETGANLLDLYYQKSPLKRIVSPEDIAKTVLYLADNKSITGQDIRLDCGVMSSMWYKPF